MIHHLAQSVTSLRWRILLCALCGLLWVGQVSATGTPAAPADCADMESMAAMDHHTTAHKTPADCCDSGGCAMAHCGAPASALGTGSLVAPEADFKPGFLYRFSVAVAPPLRLYRPPIFS